MEGHPKKSTDQTFEQILEQNKERIYRICRIYAVAPLEPKDLFQEVVFQIWKSFSSFEGRSNISTWIYRIALNVCSRSKLKSDKIDSKTDSLQSIHFSHTSHEDDDQQTKYKALHDCISQLNQVDQSLVVLYLEDLAYKEIAEISGLTENHVAVKMKRIREALFNCITHKL